MPKEQRCYICKEVKSIEEFNKDKRYNKGYCIECVNKLKK